MGKTWVKIFEGGMIAAILWAVAIGIAPRVSQARQESRLPLLIERLHEMRTAISHFKADHDGLLPGQKHAGDAITANAFAAALTGLRKDGSGPYLERIPDNPFIADGRQSAAVLIRETAGEVQEKTGWRFCTLTGQFTAGDCDFHASY